MAAVKSLIVEGGTSGTTVQIEKPIPTLLIGLGGSGKEVLMRLRKRFHDRYITKDPGYARFVFIDTDAQTFVPQEKQNEAFRGITGAKRNGRMSDHEGPVRSHVP